MTKQPGVSLTPVPLMGEVFTVNYDLSDKERDELSKVWAEMNSRVDKPKLLLILPEQMHIAGMPTKVLLELRENIDGVLQAREDFIQEQEELTSERAN